MVTGSDNKKKTHIAFFVGGFGGGKSNFYKQHKDALFPDSELVGFDHVADPLLEALNTLEENRSTEQAQLIRDITDLEALTSRNNIINHEIEKLGNDVDERIEAVVKKAPKINRTDVQKALGSEIAIYDGCSIIQKVRDGENITLDASGRPDVREGIYRLLQDNGLFEQCDFSSYNMAAPPPEELVKTVVSRLTENRKGHMNYNCHDLEKNLEGLFPPPIFIPQELRLSTEESITLEKCKEIEKGLFDDGRLKAFFVTRGSAKDNHVITEVFPDTQNVIDQHNSVTATSPDTEVTPSIVELGKHAAQLVRRQCC